MARERAVTIKFLADVKEFAKGTALGGQAAEGMAGKLGGLAGTIGSAYAVGKVVEFGKASVEAAMDDAKAQTILASTLKNTTGATDAQIASVEDFIAQTQDATGVMDDELRPAFQNLVRVTKDAQDAQGLLTLAMDISASTGKDLESVSMALAKAHEGSTGKLKALGIETKDAEGKALSFAEVQKQLTDQFGGAQAVAADTAAGKMAIMQARYADLQETIGAALLPVMSELVGVVSGVLEWFSSLDEGTQQWIVRLAMLGGGVVLATRAITGIVGPIKNVGSLLKSAGVSAGGAGLALGALGVVAAAYAVHAASAAKHTREVAKAIGEMDRASDSELADLLVKAMMEATAAGTPMKDVLADIARESISAAERLRDMAAANDTNVPLANALTEAINHELEAQKNLAENTARTNEVIDEATGANEDAAAATEEKAEADKAAEEAAKAHEDAVRSLFDAIVGAADKTLGYRDAQRDARTASDEYLLSILNLTNADKDQRTTLEDVAVAMDGAQKAMMGQAQAAADLWAAQLEANGAVLTAGDRAKIYRDELSKLAGSLAAGDPLRSNLEALIEQLGRVPRDVTTTITTKFVGGTATKGGWGGIPTASGDFVGDQRARWVGELGPELFIPDSPGTIVPAKDAPKMMSAGNSSPIIINVSVAGSVVTERQLVDVVHEGLLRKQRSGSLGLAS